MESMHRATPTQPDQLVAQFERPNAQAIWTRAVEVFGDEGKAQSWMSTRRASTKMEWNSLSITLTPFWRLTEEISRWPRMEGCCEDNFRTNPAQGASVLTTRGGLSG